jgi:hypothetical protein
MEPILSGGHDPCLAVPVEGDRPSAHPLAIASDRVAGTGTEADADSRDPGGLKQPAPRDASVGHPINAGTCDIASPSASIC